MSFPGGKRATMPHVVYLLCIEELSVPPAGRTRHSMPSPNRIISLSQGRRRGAGPDRATVALYRAARLAGKVGSKLRPAGEILPEAMTSGLDLAARLRLFQRALRNRLERRDALLDIVRAVNTTLEPGKVAELVVERAATWVPAPCWALVCADLSGQLSVLAERGLQADMGPAVYGVAGWVMQRGEEFVTADLREDDRVSDQSIASVVAFPLSCRGRRVGAVIGLDREPSSRVPRLSPPILQAVRVLLEPAPSRSTTRCCSSGRRRCRSPTT